MCASILTLTLSMELVASSRITTPLCLNNARAIANSCRCPLLKFCPPAETVVSKVIVILFSISSCVAVSDPAEEDGTISWSSCIEAAREGVLDGLCDSGLIRCTRASASIHSSSECSLKGSRLSLRETRHLFHCEAVLKVMRLYRVVPANSVASCGMNVTRERRSRVPMLVISMPSIMILPLVGSTNRRRLMA